MTHDENWLIDNFDAAIVEDDRVQVDDAIKGAKLYAEKMAAPLKKQIAKLEREASDKRVKYWPEGNN